MQCERLLTLSKHWYLHVKEETMAPARMVQFIKQHVDACPVCLKDPDIEDEIEKITEIILPESKIPKAVRLKQEAEEAEREQAEAEDKDDTAPETEGSSDEDFKEDDEEEPLPS
ncbi:MAG: hypothetical protein EX260_04810 [Desulfobulbaceae bacterium]|nr:hypothetical protein [Desulfofustis sp.]RZW23233.1 MAG: hypothetical protein EX260_04810 [Desulfobulbaceae bacterium]